MAERAAITFLLDNVTRLAKEHVDLIKNAEYQLKQLQNELGSLSAFLVHATKVPNKDESFRVTERQIRQVIYEAEDVVDSCLTHAATTSINNLFLRLFHVKGARLAKKVKSLRQKKVTNAVTQARGEQTRVPISDRSVTSVGMSSRQKDGPPDEDQVVIGFEELEDSIIKDLEEEKDELDIISIVGKPGWGKTTLAGKILNSERIKSERNKSEGIQPRFDTFIWVTASHDFNKRDAFLSMLRQFTKVKSSINMDDIALRDTLRGRLQNAKFLLVVDDVWQKRDWDDITKVLPMGNWKSKVLMTSSNHEVGAHASSPVGREPHKLSKLTLDKSWELLQLKVFGKGKNCPQQLKQTGEKIAWQCDGLPLAIVVVGGILLDQYSSEPENISEVINAWNKTKEDLPTIIAGKQDISEIVALSYRILPDDMRSCFLYLGVFPEDYEIPVWTLTHLWIAEGFIQHKEKHKSLEETAKEYLKDLINKNLVMEGKKNPNGELKTCFVQDVIRGFCISKAKEQDLFQEIEKSREGVFDPPVADIHTFRRLCIHSNLENFLPRIRPAKVKGQVARSFMCFGEPVRLDVKHFSSIPDSFDLLRVLESTPIKLSQFPKKITKLIHLRYITLSCDDLKVIDEDLAKLWNLQTLVVNTNSRTLEIRANIWKMIQLRHLKAKAEVILALQFLRGDEAGENLRTLSRLSPKCCTRDVFDKAHNLKSLGICGSLANDFNFNSLEGLNLLENLKLVNDLPEGSPSNHPLRGLPPHNSFPQNIKRLTLSATYLDWKHMSTLGALDTLQVLKLKNKAFKGDSWTVHGGFNGLQFLLIATTDLVTWEASDHDFPSLTCLVLKNCVKLKQIPSGLAQTLQILEIEHAKSVIPSARAIEEKVKQMQEQQIPRWGGFKLSIKL